MGILKELNEKAWYRFVKVVYVFMYLPSVFVIVIAFDSGKDHHTPVYPNTIEEAINDPAFYKVGNYDKRNALSAIDSYFSRLNYTEQTQFIDKINKIDIGTKEIRKYKLTDEEYLAQLNTSLPPPTPEQVLARNNTPSPESLSEMSNEELIKKYNAHEAKKNISSPKEQTRTVQGEWVADVTDQYKKPAKDSIKQKTDYDKALESGGQIINNFTPEFIAVPRKSPRSQESEGRYHYTSYYTRSIWKTVVFLIIGTLCYVLVMETVRRAFYYVAIGKIFPKKGNE